MGEGQGEGEINHSFFPIDKLLSYIIPESGGKTQKMVLQYHSECNEESSPFSECNEESSLFSECNEESPGGSPIACGNLHAHQIFPVIERRLPSFEGSLLYSSSSFYDVQLRCDISDGVIIEDFTTGESACECNDHCSVSTCHIIASGHYSIRSTIHRGNKAFWYT